MTLVILLALNVPVFFTLVTRSAANAESVEKPKQTSKSLLIVAEDIEGEALATTRRRPAFGAGSKRFLFQGQTENYRPVRKQQGRVRLDAD